MLERGSDRFRKDSCIVKAVPPTLGPDTKGLIVNTNPVQSPRRTGNQQRTGRASQGRSGRNGTPRCGEHRRGAALVEMAFVLPVFFIFILTLVEYGHVLMVTNTLTSVAKDAAHMGSFDGTSTADVTDYATTRLAAVLPGDFATISIKDAAIFELSSTDAASVDVDTLEDVELNSLETRQPFIVRIEVPYDNVSLLPTLWVRGVTLRGDSIMRRE